MAMGDYCVEHKTVVEPRCMYVYVIGIEVELPSEALRSKGST